MSAFLPEYLLHLQDELDESGDDIPAEEMTPELRTLHARMFMAALESSNTPKPPKPTKVLPGPEKVIVLRQRYERGEELFSPADLRWEDVKVRRAVTKRATVNGNPLAEALFDEKAVLAEVRAREDARKARRS